MPGSTLQSDFSKHTPATTCSATVPTVASYHMAALVNGWGTWEIQEVALPVAKPSLPSIKDGNHSATNHFPPVSGRATSSATAKVSNSRGEVDIDVVFLYKLHPGGCPGELWCRGCRTRWLAT